MGFSSALDHSIICSSSDISNYAITRETIWIHHIITVFLLPWKSLYRCIYIFSSKNVTALSLVLLTNMYFMLTVKTDMWLWDTFTVGSSVQVEIIKQVIEALQRLLTLTMTPSLHLSFHFKTLTLAPNHQGKYAFNASLTILSCGRDYQTCNLHWWIQLGRKKTHTILSHLHSYGFQDFIGQ